MVTMKKDEGAAIGVVIAADHPVFRQGLRQAIESDRHIQVVGEAADGEAAIALLRALDPDVVVLDIGMPKSNGFAVARAMREGGLRSRSIFLTMYDEEDAFNRAMDLGVKGYILKDSAVTDIVIHGQKDR